MKFLNPYIKMMSTINGHDKSLRFVQYLFMFLRGKRTEQNGKNLRAKIMYTAWITRKVLRLGLPYYIVKKIISRFLKLSVEEPIVEEKIEQALDNSDNDDVNFSDIHMKFNKDKLIHMTKTLEKSSIHGLAGHETRMILTKTVKDLAFIVYLLVDVPLYFKEIQILKLSSEKFDKLRKIQYISWFIKCILSVVYQLVELKHLREYIKSKSVSLHL